jgi:hypothetical protein
VEGVPGVAVEALSKIARESSYCKQTLFYFITCIGKEKYYHICTLLLCIEKKCNHCNDHTGPTAAGRFGRGSTPTSLRAWQLPTASRWGTPCVAVGVMSSKLALGSIDSPGANVRGCLLHANTIQVLVAGGGIVSPCQFL